MSQIISSVVPAWTARPFTRVSIRLSRKSQSSTRPGPRGHRVSDPFTRSIEPASGRPGDIPAVRVDRGDRFVEVRRRAAERRLELRAAALVVQVDADDLR